MSYNYKATYTGSWLGDMTRLSYVPRWVIVPMVRPQSVAEHSFRVAAIVKALCIRLDWDPIQSNQLVVDALTHDIGEAQSGDTPGTFKEHTPPEFLKTGDLIVALADKLEGISWFFKWGSKALHPDRFDDIIAHSNSLAAPLNEELAKRIDKDPEELHKMFLELSTEIE